MVTRLHQRRLAACLGDIDHLKSRYNSALRQGITTASQVVWISDGARGFWRLYRECFVAVGILDFYHAQHLWQAASLYQDNPAHTQQQWFARMRHQLRHGFVSALSKNGLVKQV